MNSLQKFAFLLAAGLALAACNNAGSDNGKSDSTNTATADGHQHTYRCPMHPEVTGKEGDTCPKCGMKLEHSDEAPGGNASYFMQLATAPTTAEPNKDVTLSLTPKKRGAESEQVALDVEHEKKIHLILVSDDLSWFDHIHPEYTAEGAYAVKAKFPAPGTYHAFADYRPTGGGHVVDKLPITVNGTAPAAKTFGAEKLSGTSGAYSFTLEPSSPLATGKPLRIAGVVKKDGKEIDASTLENYLGAKAHFVLISLNEKEYLHVHPNVEQGRFDLHTTVAKPGLYRGWVQFNAEGQLHTIDFTMNVAQGAAGDAAKATHDGHAGH